MTDTEIEVDLNEKTLAEGRGIRAVEIQDGTVMHMGIEWKAYRYEVRRWRPPPLTVNLPGEWQTIATCGSRETASAIFAAEFAAVPR